MDLKELIVLNEPNFCLNIIGLMNVGKAVL